MRYLVLALFGPVFAAPSLDRIPAWFEPNAGHFTPSVRYASRSAAGSVLIDDQGASFRLPGRSSLRMDMVGRNPRSRPVSGRRLAARTDYFLGNQRSEWRTGVAHYADIRFRGVYAGIDAVFYSSGKHLEYDFIVAPGADPSLIRLRFRGAKVRIDADGNLVLRSGGETIKHLAPYVYQGSGSARTQVAGRYWLARNGEVRFALGGYDRSRELVIDPVLTYASYLGGTGTDSIQASAVDKQGRLWVTGTTSSQIELPLGVEPPQGTKGGESDAFLAGIETTEDGKPNLVYYSYLGGTSSEQGTAITIDPNGYINIAGTTNSFNFPLGGNANQINSGGDIDAFVAQIHPQDAGAAALFYSSYYGGVDREIPAVIAATATRIAVAGYTNAGVLPGAGDGSLQKSNRGGIDTFFFVTNPYSPTAAEALTYASFLGGNGTDLASGLAFDASGALLISGFTASTDFPIAGSPYQAFLSGRGDAFLTRLDLSRPALDALVYSTYIGGTDVDAGEAMRIDASGAIWIAGYTFSPDFPTSINAYERRYKGSADGFLARIDLAQPSSGAITYATYLGGTGADIPYAMTLDSAGKVWISGYTNSSDFPRLDPIRPQPAMVITEAFAARIDPAVAGADGLTISTLFGGAGTDVATAVSVDAAGNAFLAGYSTSTNLPTTNETGKPSIPGLRSGFFLRMSSSAEAARP